MAARVHGAWLPQVVVGCPLALSLVRCAVGSEVRDGGRVPLSDGGSCLPTGFLALDLIIDNDCRIPVFLPMDLSRSSPSGPFWNQDLGFSLPLSFDSCQLSHSGLWTLDSEALALCVGAQAGFWILDFNASISPESSSEVAHLEFISRFWLGAAAAFRMLDAGSSCT